MDLDTLAAQIEERYQAAVERARNRAEAVVGETEAKGGKFSPEAHALLVDYHVKNLLAQSPMWRNRKAQITKGDGKMPEEAKPKTWVDEYYEKQKSDEQKKLDAMIEERVQAAIEENDRKRAARTLAEMSEAERAAMSSEEFQQRVEAELHKKILADQRKHRGPAPGIKATPGGA